MIYEIEHFNDSTDWIASDPAITLEDESVFVFEEGGTSLKLSSGENMSGQSIHKIYSSPIDLTNYSEIRFQIRSRDIEGFKFTSSDDFYLIIELSTDGEPDIYKWYVPIYEKATFNCITIDVADLTSFDTVRFKFNSDLDKTFWLDYMIAIEPEMEFDMLMALKNLLNEQISVPLGNLAQAASPGDSSLLLSDDSFLVQGSLIKIVEGATTEYHQIKDVPYGLSVNFTPLKDGQTVQNAFTTSAQVYFVVPADFKNVSEEIFMPGITIWGFNPERMPERDSEAGDYYDYAEDTKMRVRKKLDDRNFDYNIQITSESYSLEILQLMNKLVRSNFDDDSFFQVGGHPINYESIGSDFSFGEDEENAHSSVRVFNFWTFESYQRGIQYSLEKTMTLGTQILSGEDL